MTAQSKGELFAAYRHHAEFSDSPLGLVHAEKAHRGHATIEQVHADLRSGPLAHLHVVSRPGGLQEELSAHCNSAPAAAGRVCLSLT